MKQSASYLQRLKRYPLLCNLLLIVAAIALLALAAHGVMQLGTRHGARRTVPDFAGIPLDRALRLAAENDLELTVNDSLFVPAYEGGIVLDQLPEKGVEVKPGRTVYVTINSFRQKMVPVPYVAGRSLRQAKNMLEIGGLEIAELVYRPDIATNYVLEEFLDGKPVLAASRMEAEMGSGVTLYVGVEEGSGTTVVPQLTGLSLEEAKSRIWESGLNVGKVGFDSGIDRLNEKDARIYVQSPDPERAAMLGGKVELRLTLDAKKVSESRAANEKLARAIAEERIREERERADSLAAAGVEFPAEPAENASAAAEGAPGAAEPAGDNSGFFD